METSSIKELMSTRFAKIHPAMPVVEASSNLIKQDMLGSPVTDDSGTLVGWISERECLQAALQVVYHNQRVATVKDLMQTEVLTVSLDSDVLSLAQQMLNAKPKIYPVVDASNKVLGVISRRHILNMLDDKLAELSKKAS
ncbi:MAG: CBS domain-containing protein [Alcanivorax sediminis]|uniref:CBS domain-containing protein n=1 Tax=Alcanivorax sediminis TaxID=2663008 RepID=A0A6N7LT15_9GAMM|nr:CBS domain-containing protein [Alcanivorax sediminis]MQX53557.1 CBS domain-containing protein [Alcanivorax sediminis]